MVEITTIARDTRRLVVTSPAGDVRTFDMTDEELSVLSDRVVSLLARCGGSLGDNLVSFVLWRELEAWSESNKY